MPIDNIPTMGLMAELLDGRKKEGEYIFILHPHEVWLVSV